MFQIEKNIPIPEANTKHKKYPFRDMEVGDSFFVPAEAGEETRRITKNILGSSRSTRVKDKKFRTQQQDSPSGIRCWRIK